MPGCSGIAQVLCATQVSRRALHSAPSHHCQSHAGVPSNEHYSSKQWGWDNCLCTLLLDVVFKLEVCLPSMPSAGLCLCTDTATATAQLCTFCSTSTLVPCTAQGKFKPTCMWKILLTQACVSLACALVSLSYSGRPRGEALLTSRALERHWSMQLERHF